jgi:two-component system response regulator YesN
VRKLDQIPIAYGAALEQVYYQQNQSKTLQIVKKYIECNFNDSSLSLQRASRELGISCQHISRLFRQETENTFVEYLTKIRVRKAVSLLLSTDMLVCNIAEMVGYTSQYYFSNVFKKTLGVSPLEYRRLEVK